MTPAKLRTLAGAIGYGTGEGFKLEGSWEHRNLFPPEGLLRVRGIAGTEEQLLGVTFRKNNFGGRDKILTVDAFASTIDYDAYDARTVSLVGTYERVSTLLFQKPFSYSGGLELVATRERERDAAGNLGPPQTFFVAALPGFAQIDTSDDLLDPTRGFRLGLRASPEISRTEGVESFYLRGQLDASYYLRASDRIVLAARTRVASIPGAPLAAIAPSRRVYAGGGGSVRGYEYKGIGPHDSEGDPSGGRSLLELSAEARIRTGLLDGALGIVPFVDAGTVGDEATPSFDEIKVGVGVGLRYYTGFGPLRLDLAVPLNPGPGDPDIGVYVALGHTF
jgi:translocation and assembly module TamA